MPFRIVMAAMLGLLTLSTHAETGVGIELGSTGYGFDITRNITPSIDARIGFSRFEYSVDIATKDIKYDGKAKLSDLRAVADWYIAGSFRMTGGFYLQNNKVNVSGKSYIINGQTYTPEQIGTTSGYGKFSNPVAPYIGIGYGRPGGKGLQFYADLGVMYQGTAKVSLGFQCAGTLSTNSCNRLKSRTEQEQDDLYDKIKDYRLWPVASIGLSYAF